MVLSNYADEHTAGSDLVEGFVAEMAMVSVSGPVFHRLLDWRAYCKSDSGKMEN